MAHSSLIRVVDAKGNVDLDGRGSDVQMMNVAGQVTVNGSYSGTMEFKKLTKSLHFESPNSEMRVAGIPGSLTLDLSDLRINNAVGPIRFHTKSRDIHIEEYTDTLDIDVSDRGDIEASTTKNPLGKLDVHTKNGNIDLGLPENAAFDLRETTSQGDAHNEYGPAVKLETFGRSASLTSAGGKGPSVVATTDRGSVSVKKSSAPKD